MNWGVERSYGIISFKTGFLLQGQTSRETFLNTGAGNGWKVLKNEGLYEKTVYWRGSSEIVGGFYAANPTDSIVAAQYAWGWRDLNYDDRHWVQPEAIFSQPKTSAGFGHGWILQPRTTTIQTNRKEALTRIARTDLPGIGPDFQFGKKTLTIPANARHTLLFDQGYVTLGYPRLTLSKGKDAAIRVKYSEALYNEQNQKGNRNKIEGKVIKGISDVYVPDGNITSCYPLKATFVHPTYSLIWIDILHDLMMREGKPASIEPYLGEIQEVFDYYESLINENGLVGKSEYKMFIDWYLPKGGNSPANENGNSAILTLNYAYTLARAADILEWLGYREKAAFYRSQSNKYAATVRRWCFDPDRGIYADDPEKTFYDQRASILAVLAGAHTGEEAIDLMKKVLDEKIQYDSRANLFYYFYLFEAMEKTGVGDFTDALQPWRKIVEMGMTATPEKRIEQHPRSEVHPWTAHPVHVYFSLVTGIQPSSPGFRTVRIAPHPGNLEYIKAAYPTVRGEVRLDLRFEKSGQVEGSISLPKEMTGTFDWQGVQIGLQPEQNEIDFSKLR